MEKQKKKVVKKVGKVVVAKKVVKVQPRNKKSLVTKLIKRSGRVVPFDQKKIAIAVTKAFAATGEGSPKEAQKVSDKVV